MQTTGEAFGEEVVPDTPCAVGAVAILETVLDLVEQSLSSYRACWLGERFNQA